MFSKIIRLGVAITGAAILSSCGGDSGQTETQQSTPEGLFEGSSAVYVNSTGAVTTTTSASGVVTPAPTCTQNMVVFVNYAGAFFSFVTNPTTTNPAAIISASSGTLTFSGGTMSAAGVIEVTPPNAINPSATAPNGTDCGVPITSAVETINGVTQVNNETTSPSLTGGYNTAQNIAGTFTYPSEIDAAGDFKTTVFNINYDADYQNTQSLGTLAGTYSGTVASSQLSEAATFTFGPASVAANSANEFGVGVVSGTGASGCAYTGTVSPLFRGNGYNLVLTSGPSPCLLTGASFAGLVYLDTTHNLLYSFSPNGTRTDGLIFTGTRNL
ncbi:MAG TPA: hypothetical protein VK832_00865 [Burkholderiaceae bacterium]|nr:hypothetical protein [Burkholderiaceae bacterium]